MCRNVVIDVCVFGHAMLCHVILCLDRLCHAMVWHVMLGCVVQCYATWWNCMPSCVMWRYAVLYFMWCDIICYVLPGYAMMCYDMLWCDMMCRVRPWCVMSCHDMLQSVMSCYVVLCYVVLCYGQTAQTFYMCLESLVGCMNDFCWFLHTPFGWRNDSTKFR